MTAANRERVARHGRRHVPVLLKIAPDLGWAQIDAVLAVIAGKAKGWPTRGFLVCVLLGGVAIATWAVMGVWIGA